MPQWHWRRLLRRVLTAPVAGRHAGRASLAPSCATASDLACCARFKFKWHCCEMYRLWQTEGVRELARQLEPGRRRKLQCQRNCDPPARRQGSRLRVRAELASASQFKLTLS